MYVFTPPDGRSWGLTYEGLEAGLRERNPEEFVRVDDGSDGPVRGSSMHFGVTLGEEQLEGMALLSPEGVSVLDRTAHSAARLALWLRNNVLPGGTVVMFNSEWGLEADLPPAPVPDAGLFADGGGQPPFPCGLFRAAVGDLSRAARCSWSRIECGRYFRPIAAHAAAYCGVQMSLTV
ncbi:hypothetical protein [Streptomyces sp. NBC_00986]|uniref:hypothetical protein n=1 Tax=Streptomyces sp. NBC_00986 TaxID=2903702 RepID=UPI0038633E38|nr:hypothetical protein OG504_45780 [Streptomyces sp. NBC_00986]